VGTAAKSLPNMKSALGSYCVIKRRFRNEPHTRPFAACAALYYVTTAKIEWACDSINSDIVSTLDFFFFFFHLHHHRRRRRRRLFKSRKKRPVE
jgi:hypothetical protein